MKKKPDAYLDSLEFLPSEMERMVRSAIEERDGKAVSSFSEEEVELRLRLFREKRHMERLKKYRALLAAACLFLTVGMAAALFRPVGVRGNNTYITFYTGDGSEERFVFRYQDVETPYGRTHDYQSFSELEAVLGFRLAKPSGQEADSLYLEARPGSGLYSVTASFGEDSLIAGYQAYLVRDSEESYGYPHSISQDWERLEEKELGGRQAVLYQIEGGAAYGAALSENGILYVMAAKEGVALEEWEEILAGMTYRR